MQSHGTVQVMKERAKSRVGWIATTIWMSRALHRELAIASLDDHVAQNELMRRALREWLDRRAGKRRPRRSAT